MTRTNRGCSQVAAFRPGLRPFSPFIRKLAKSILLTVVDRGWTAPTIAELVQRYLNEQVSKQAPNPARGIASMMNIFVLPAWGKRKAIGIRTADVDKRLSEVGQGRARPHRVRDQRRSAPTGLAARSGRFSISRSAGRCGQTIRRPTSSARRRTGLPWLSGSPLS